MYFCRSNRESATGSGDERGVSSLSPSISKRSTKSIPKTRIEGKKKIKKESLFSIFYRYFSLISSWNYSSEDGEGSDEHGRCGGGGEVPPEAHRDALRQRLRHHSQGSTPPIENQTLIFNFKSFFYYFIYILEI